MDPDDVLARLRALVRDARNAGSDADAAAVVDEMGPVFDALDDFLSDGGRLPDAWSRAQDPNVRGCSCGMADYGAPGHDGAPDAHPA